MQRGDQPSQSGPALKKIDITIARLRLLLADVSAREKGVEDQRRVLREQQNKLVTFSMYGDSSLDSVLGMLGDVQERLGHLDATAQSLSAIRKRAEYELESLQLTKGSERTRGAAAAPPGPSGRPRGPGRRPQPRGDSGRNRAPAGARFRPESR